MKLIDKNTGKTLYSVLGGENLTLDEAIEWAGAEATEDQTYIIDGEEYSYEDLDWVANSYQPENDDPEEPESCSVTLTLVNEDYARPDSDEVKAYYGYEGEKEARLTAARIDKWADSHSWRSRRPDDLPTSGGVTGYELAFESTPELHRILNTRPADDLLYAYVVESGNLLKVVDEDAEGGIELRELLETKHSRAVELRFSYSFAELAKEVIIDQGKRITAEEAIKRYGFLRLIDDIFAQKCYVFKDYALDIIGEYHEKYDDDEKNDYYDDEHSYAHTIKRLAEPGYHMTQVELIEKLAKSDCFPEGAAL
jgi:hypothetical protein